MGTDSWPCGWSHTDERGRPPVGEMKIGMRVETVFRKLGSEGEAGVIHYGYKFRPAV